VTNKLSFTAAILAGGDSSRMGKDKAFLDLGGKPLIEIIYERLDGLFAEVLVVANTPQKFRQFPARTVTDIYREGRKNALRGIHAGLMEASYPSCFVMACDMPFVSGSLLRYMSQFASDYDLVIPFVEGYYQPLFAFYHKSTLGPIAGALEKQEHKIINVYEELSMKKITEKEVRSCDPEMLSFINVNTVEDYERARRYFARTGDHTG